MQVSSDFSASSISPPALSAAGQALYEVASWLRDQCYRFTTVTPETHRRVMSRREPLGAASLRDVFGWNLAFDPALLPAPVLDRLEQADAIAWLSGGRARSKVRFGTLAGAPYVHSAFPTDDMNAVFFGPDTYRFASLIERVLADAEGVARVVDVGCGAGAGGLVAGASIARQTGRVPRLEFVDLNECALDMARVNAATFGVSDAAFRAADLYEQVQTGVDLMVSNPPYLLDDDQRTYRHGGGSLGSGLSERIVKEGLPLLAPGGRLVLYTGSAIVEGRDGFREAALSVVDPDRHDVSYIELDPDVFGEELDRAPYRQVERIAAVALVVRRDR